MKKKHLRIGNLIKIDGIIVTVDARTLFDFDHDRRVKEGVRLTEELLKNIGCFQQPFFKQTRLCLPQLNGSTIDLQLTVSEAGGFVLWIVNDGDTTGTPLKIVREFHELQNVYFALTNEELTLKY